MVFSVALSFIRIQLLELELRASYLPDPSCSDENSGTVWCLYRKFCSCTPPDPSVHLPELQAAAFSLISLCLLHPHSGHWVAAVRSDAEDPGHLLYPSVSGHGWLETCGHPGQAHHLALLQQEIVKIHSKWIWKSGKGFVGVGSKELLGWPWPLSPSLLGCVPHS